MPDRPKGRLDWKAEFIPAAQARNCDARLGGGVRPLLQIIGLDLYFSASAPILMPPLADSKSTGMVRTEGGGVGVGVGGM